MKPLSAAVISLAALLGALVFVNAQANNAAAIAADLAGSTPATQSARAAAAGALTGAADTAGVTSLAAADAQQYAAAVAAATGAAGLFAQPVQFQIGASASEVMTADFVTQLSAMQTALHGAAFWGQPCCNLQLPL